MIDNQNSTVATGVLSSTGTDACTSKFGSAVSGLNTLCESESKTNTVDNDEHSCSCCGAVPSSFLPLRQHPHGTITKAFSEISLARCQGCGFERAVPWPTAGQLQEFYNGPYNDKMKRTYGLEPMSDGAFPARRAAAQAAFIQSASQAVLTPQQKASGWPRIVAEGGAGWGRLLREFAFGPGSDSRVLHMFEYDEEALKYAKDVECRGTGAELVLHFGECCAAAQDAPKDAEKLPLVAPGSVDLVLSSHTIEHVPRPLEALQAWAEMLKPGGLLFLEGPMENPHPLNCVSADDPYYGGHISFFRPKHYLALCERAGLMVLRIETTNEPVNPVLNQDKSNGVELLGEGSDVFTGEDRLVRVLCRKPSA